MEVYVLMNPIRHCNFQWLAHIYWASEPVNVVVLHFAYLCIYFLFHSGLSYFI